MQTEFKYQLDATSKKYHCPECTKKTFVPYVYADSMEVVADKYGRCDRQNNCGHHVHPNEDNDFTPSHKVTPKPKPEEVQIYPDPSVTDLITKRTKTCTSHLHKYCKRMGITSAHMLIWGVYTDGANGEKTVFIFRRQGDNKIVNLKWFKYKENGHRDKQFNSFSLKQPPHTPPKKTTDPIRINKYFLGLFGEHLLSLDNSKTVCVVESEKTAAIASFFYKDYDWVSCASANGLTDVRIKVLYNRKVFWICDADKAGRSNSSINRAKNYLLNFHLVDLFPDRTDGYDIADAIVDGLRPEIIPTKSFDQETTKKEWANKKATADLYSLPEGVELDKVKHDIDEYGHFVHDNCIYMIKGTRVTSAAGEEYMKYYSMQISNFQIQSLGHIQSKHFPRRLLKITNIKGTSKVLEMPTKAFVSNTEFAAFIESEGNFQWDGTTMHQKKVRSKIYNTMDSFDEVTALGWHHSGHYIFANGAYNGKVVPNVPNNDKFVPIDEFGFVKLGNRNLFIEPLSAVNTKNEDSNTDFEDEKKFVYVQRDVTLKDWATLFCDVHKENGQISLAWFITSLFRDHIYNRFKFFPHLFLFGPPGTGKSQVGWSVRAMGFNAIKKPFNLSGGTKVSFHREFSHFVNFPCWFDEYDNSIDYDRIQSLKAAYDGAGHKKSVKDSDSRTKTVPVHSSTMISGQQLPIADNALFKRVILAQFNQTEYSKKEKDLFRKLQDMEEGGLSHITAAFMHFRELVEKEYLNTFEEVLSDMIKSMGDDNIEDRILRNMCIIMAIIKLMEPRLKKSLPFTYEQLKVTCIQNIKQQMALISSANETNTFWDMVSYLIDQQLIAEEVDFLFRSKSLVKIVVNREVVERNLGATKKLLFVRMSRIIPLYRENFKRQNSTSSSPMDKGSLIHYLQHNKAYLGLSKGTKFEKASSSAHIFDYDILKNQGVELERGFSDSNIQEEVSDALSDSTEEPHLKF